MNLTNTLKTVNVKGRLFHVALDAHGAVWLCLYERPALNVKTRAIHLVPVFGPVKQYTRHDPTNATNDPYISAARRFPPSTETENAA